MEDPTTAVLEERLKHMQKKISESDKKADKLHGLIFGKLEAIHTQTLITNGRVNRLEKGHEHHDSEIKSLRRREGEGRYFEGRATVIIVIVLALVTGLVEAAVRTLL